MSEVIGYERIKGTVASLLFLFAEIEGEARRILSRAELTERKAKMHGAGAVLNAWKDLLQTDGTSRAYEASLALRLWEQMQGPLDVRNGICHGLIGASAERNGSAATLCWRVDGDVRSMTYDELQGMFAWLSKVPHAIGMISHAVGVDDPSKLRPLPTPDFWESEFGLKLHQIS